MELLTLQTFIIKLAIRMRDQIQILESDLQLLLLPPPLINQLEDDLIPRSPYILAPLLANPPPASEVRLAPYGDLVACGILPGPARTAT